MRPAQRPFFDAGTFCWSEGISFPPYVFPVVPQQICEIVPGPGEE
jgi:hypothetical protein